jgi:hypothetical protein
MDAKSDRRTPHSSSQDCPHRRILLRPFRLGKPNHKRQKSSESVEGLDAAQHRDTCHNCGQPRHFARDFKEPKRKFHKQKRNAGKKGNPQTLLETTEIIDDNDASELTDFSYSGSEVLYKLQDEGSYFDIGGPLCNEDQQGGRGG